MTASSACRVLVYPMPEERPVFTEIFEVTDDDEVVLSEGEVREHPEVPLSVERRDEVLARMGFMRVGPWDEEGNERAQAPVRVLTRDEFRARHQ
ncbi:hypothetical protein [Streptomyces sp. NPDC015350]|uniref:hypothetical protein n=1 Tax=Streptomyces sp. NPDC015350 TaxID=3364955 RepID=UPI0036F872FC